MINLIFGVIFILIGYFLMVQFNETPEHERGAIQGNLPLLLYAVGIYLIINAF
tara:strand:+ start:357 stop:515 length:159 start_codon:yes stop_codon:yes gene_type:complete